MSDQKTEPKTVADIIDDIESRSSGGGYIFRGEPECHEERPYFGKVSSNLWREYLMDEEYFDIELVQKERIVSAKRHTRDLPPDFRVDVIAERDRENELKKKKANNELTEADRQALKEMCEKKQKEKAADFEILAKIQHYGGTTNLIDFTTDYLIALFFACEKRYSKEDGEVGRVIIQKIDEIKDMIEYPKNPQHRVVAQKSVFIRPPKGFIEINFNMIVRIPSALKQPILKYLRDHHGIYTESVYNDLHGFIRQNNEGDTYSHFYKGLSFGKRARKAKGEEEKKMWYNKSIEHYSEAIELRPDDPFIYINRANAYLNIDNAKKAFDDYKTAIDLRPDDYWFYYRRAKAYIKQDEIGKAIDDYNNALERQSDDYRLYCGRGIAHAKQGNSGDAFDDHDKAINLNPNLFFPRFSRACVYYELGIYYLKNGDVVKSKSNLMSATADSFLDLTGSFEQDYGSVADFEQKYDVQVPPDIAAILTDADTET